MAAITVLKTTTTTETVVVSPELLAQAFCEMDSTSQALFFNEVGRITEAWEMRDGFSIQMWTVIRNKTLNQSGLNVFDELENLLSSPRPKNQ